MAATREQPAGRLPTKSGMPNQVPRVAGLADGRPCDRYGQATGHVPGQCGDPNLWRWWGEHTKGEAGVEAYGRRPWQQRKQSATIRPPFGTMPSRGCATAAASSSLPTHHFRPPSSTCIRPAAFLRGAAPPAGGGAAWAAGGCRCCLTGPFSSRSLLTPQTLKPPSTVKSEARPPASARSAPRSPRGLARAAAEVYGNSTARELQAAREQIAQLHVWTAERCAAIPAAGQTSS